MSIPGFDRLGVVELIADHNRTLYRLDGRGHRHPRVADRLVLWGLPAVVGVGLVWRKVALQDLGPILNGTAILTGGLFTLLVMIFGVQVAGRPAGGTAVVELIRETRANVAYATAWALCLTILLMMLQAFRTVSPQGAVGALAPVWTAVVLAMLTHLVLVLLLVLNRIRLAFSSLTF